MVRLVKDFSIREGKMPFGMPAIKHNILGERNGGPPEGRSAKTLEQTAKENKLTSLQKAKCWTKYLKLKNFKKAEKVLIDAYKKRDLRFFIYLIDKKQELKKFSHDYALESGFTKVYQEAVKADDVEALAILIKFRPEYELDYVDNSLEIALTNKCHEALEFLLNSEKRRDSDDIRNLMSKVVTERDLKAIEIIDKYNKADTQTNCLHRGAWLSSIENKPNGFPDEEYIVTPFQQLVVNGDLKLITKFYELGNIKAEDLDHYMSINHNNEGMRKYMNAVMIAASTGRGDILRAFKGRTGEIPVNSMNDFGDTALSFVVRNGESEDNINLIQYLIEEGASLNFTPEDNQENRKKKYPFASNKHPLIIAIDKGYGRIQDLFIARLLNDEDQLPAVMLEKVIFHLIKQKDFNTVDELMKKFSPEISDKVIGHGYPVNSLRDEDNLEGIKFYYKQGVEPNYARLFESYEELETYYQAKLKGDQLNEEILNKMLKYAAENKYRISNFLKLIQEKNIKIPKEFFTTFKENDNDNYERFMVELVKHASPELLKKIHTESLDLSQVTLTEGLTKPYPDWIYSQSPMQQVYAKGASLMDAAIANGNFSGAQLLKDFGSNVNGQSLEVLTLQLENNYDAVKEFIEDNIPQADRKAALLKMHGVFQAFVMPHTVAFEFNIDGLEPDESVIKAESPLTIPVNVSGGLDDVGEIVISGRNFKTFRDSSSARDNFYNLAEYFGFPDWRQGKKS